MSGDRKPGPLDALRAFGVTVGGSVVLAAAATASVGSTARAVLRARKPRPWAVTGTTVVALYALRVRPWHLHWSSTPAETGEPLPGDELVPTPGVESTRAVTIEAPVETVWPWLAQLGQDRGGFYSYEWLETSPAARC